MSRFVNVLFALILLAALVIALDPGTRSRALQAVRDLEPTLRKLDDQIIVNLPSVNDPDEPSLMDPTPTPVPAPIVEDKQIPVTGGEDSSDEPIVQVNWDALEERLREYWERLKNVEIDLNPNDNR